MTAVEDHYRDPRQTRATREWVARSVRLLEAEAARSADTHLHRLPLPADWGTDLYLKDEAAQPTGSLKHRLARSLFLYGLCNGWIGPGTTVVEASSGSTAVSEAHFAQLIGIPFVAVMPRSVSREKVRLIESHGGNCHFVDGPADMTPAARRLAAEFGGHFLDQFTYAERATDWRGNNNIAESLFEQLRRERHPVPEWIVVGAGTGGTSATIGRYLRYRGHPTRLAVADPENSAFLDAWLGRRRPDTVGPLRIEGIGRPTTEPSFLPTVVDRMMRVPDAASIAAMRWLREHTGRYAGPSTGTNLWAALRLAEEMARAGQPGSLVTLLCDAGERYATTCYDDRWLSAQKIDISGHSDILDKMLSM